MLKPTPQWILWVLVMILRAGHFGRQLLIDDENRAPMCICAFIKVGPESLLIPSSVRTQQNDGCLGSGPSPDTQSTNAFILDFLPVKYEKQVLLISHTVHGIFVIATHME